MTTWRQQEIRSIRSPLDTEKCAAKRTPRSQKVQETGHDGESTSRIVNSGRSGSEPCAARAICPGGEGLRKEVPLVMNEPASARAADTLEEVHSKVAPISVGMPSSGRAGMPLGDHPKAGSQFIKDPWKRARALAGNTAKCNHMLQNIAGGTRGESHGRQAHGQRPQGVPFHTWDGGSTASVKRTEPLCGPCQPGALTTALEGPESEIGQDKEVDDTSRGLRRPTSGEARNLKVEGEIYVVLDNPLRRQMSRPPPAQIAFSVEDGGGLSQIGLFPEDELTADPEDKRSRTAALWRVVAVHSEDNVPDHVFFQKLPESDLRIPRGLRLRADTVSLSMRRIIDVPKHCVAAWGEQEDFGKTCHGPVALGGRRFSRVLYADDRVFPHLAGSEARLWSRHVPPPFDGHSNHEMKSCENDAGRKIYHFVCTPLLLAWVVYNCRVAATVRF